MAVLTQRRYGLSGRRYSSFSGKAGSGVVSLPSFRVNVSTQFDGSINRTLAATIRTTLSTDIQTQYRCDITSAYRAAAG